MRVAACRSLLVLLAAGAAIPRPVAADACPPAILEEPYQEGQDVVMRAGGWALLWRDSELETVNLPLPSETATSWCGDPRAIGCSPVPCGEVRDRCVLPDRYTYRMQAGFYDYHYTIDVHDSGDVCLDGCARVAWLDMQVDEAGVSFVLMSDGPGRLYRVVIRRSLYGTPDVEERVQIADIGIADLAWTCLDPHRYDACCLRCARIVDPCPGVTGERVRYEFESAAGGGFGTSGTVPSQSTEGPCMFGPGILDPGSASCAPLTFGDAGAGSEPHASGSGLGCAFGPAPGTSMLVLLALVALGCFALHRACSGPR